MQFASTLADMQRACKEDSARWFPLLRDDTQHHVIGLCGETGEVANAVKKWQRGSMTRDELIKKVGDEAADVLVYLCTLANTLDIDLEEEFNAKRRFNEGRYGPESRNRSTGAGSESGVRAADASTSREG